MRFVTCSVLVALTAPASAADWTDLPALIAATEAPVLGDLRACVKGKLPKSIGYVLARGKRGTSAGMPLYGVGFRGITPEQRCLGTAVAKLAFPELPAGIEQVTLGLTIRPATAPTPPPDPAWGAWKDLASALTTLIDGPRRATLAACDGKARTVRIVVDRTTRATRIWLPAWQFHSPKGDGTTPPAEQRVKACMTKAMRTWTAPALPAGLGELQISIAVKR